MKSILIASALIVASNAAFAGEVTVHYSCSDQVSNGSTSNARFESLSLGNVINIPSQAGDYSRINTLSLTKTDTSFDKQGNLAYLVLSSNPGMNKQISVSPAVTKAISVIYSNNTIVSGLPLAIELQADSHKITCEIRE